jgi:hypothetical protein
VLESPRNTRGRLIAAVRTLAVASVVVAGCHACTSFGAAADASPDAPADGGTEAAIVDAEAPRASSCGELLRANPSLRGKSDFYEIASGDAGSLRVYCEMTLDDGGWTLVGRSALAVPGVPPPFGWAGATGKVDNSTAPYSLDVVSNHLAFTEVLVATQDSTRAYKFPVGPEFLATAAGTTTPTGTIFTVAGDCGAPSMLRNAAPAEPNIFFFRDIADLGQSRGLKPGGFDLSYPDECRGGFLDGAQGVVLVR